MSLPYPSMVFVPLDILTAEEMNQLVSNIESLSAGTGLADGAITSDKIDWTTACEIVSNANGTAYKFGNGLMICTVAKEVTTDVTYGIYQWNFPVAFTAFPVVSAPICRTSTYVVIAPSVDGGNATVANIKSNKLADGSVLTSATLPTFTAFAIGRWK